MKKDNVFCGQGFTLIEIILYFGLLSIFMLVLVDVFTSSLAIKTESESSSAITQDSNYILSRISFDLTNADVNASNPANSVTILTPQSLQFSKSSVTYTYSLNNGNLILDEGGVSAKLNGVDTQITSLSFTKIGNSSGKPTVQIIFTIASRAVGPNVDSPKVFQTTVGLR